VWEVEGLNLIAAGSVAVLTMAGGQGSRLGFDGPKGAFNIGLPSRSTLFGIFAQRIRRLQRLAAVAGVRSNTTVQAGGVQLLWLIMTSPSNHAATQTFFNDNNHFNLSTSQVKFFQQTTLPAFSPAGEILLASKVGAFVLGG
jgi:UDP-N-acetylglucosamine/UDP-N-acetylgalactosamine diphosphorylase